MRVYHAESLPTRPQQGSRVAWCCVFAGSMMGTSTIKDGAHGLGARHGRLCVVCESEIGDCSAHLDGEMRTDDQALFVLSPSSSIYH